MKLHENNKLFRQAVQFTAQQMRIPDIYIEKDYWVTFALHTIFHHPIGKDLVFKGGTALLKCFGLISRFSEDIDFVVLRREGETNNQLTSKIRQISRVLNAVLPEVEIEGVTQKMGMNRKTAHTYAKEFKGDYGQVRDVIIVEASWLGHHEPYTTKSLSSYAGDMMIKNEQQDLAIEYGLMPFDILVLDPKRTICEKIMSLVRFSYTDEAIEDLKKKIRHTYDLYLLLKQKQLSDFFDSSALDQMMLKVANDDIDSYKNNHHWLIHHPNEALIFKELENVWEQMKPTYSGEFRNLVYGEFPDEADVVATLFRIKERLTSIEWTITNNEESEH
jgi:hypothetical protein